MSAATHTLTYERREACAWLTMTRPDRRNALDPDLIAELSDAFARAKSDADIRTVVITGSPGAFCAGADLKFVAERIDAPEAIVDDFLAPLTALLRTIRSFPKPVLAAVDGACVAGGLELILCCDLVLASSEARFADGHSRAGLLPAVGGAQGLTRKVGPARAKEMLFTGLAYSAQEMREAGLVNRVVDSADLASTTAELAGTLAERHPRVLRRMKQMVNDEAEMPWDVAARYELSIAEQHLTTGIAHVGIQAFLDGSTPDFSNREGC